MCTKQDQDR